MNPQKFYHHFKRLGPMRPVYFLVIALLFLAIAIHALRQNNFKMIELRNAVIISDQEDGDTETALRNLRIQVVNHMNTNLASGEFAIRPPIQLKARYERLVAAEQPRVSAANAEVAKQGEAICAKQFPAGGFNAPRVACVQDYVGQHAITTAQPIPDDLYKFDFISPRWSPDLAGWSLVASAVFFLVFLGRVAVEKWAKYRLA
jgi:hypothetical protein